MDNSRSRRWAVSVTLFVCVSAWGCDGAPEASGEAARADEPNPTGGASIAPVLDPAPAERVCALARSHVIGAREVATLESKAAVRGKKIGATVMPETLQAPPSSQADAPSLYDRLQPKERK